MKVHFASTTSRLAEMGDVYLRICQVLKSEGHIILRDWVPGAIELKQNISTFRHDDIYEDVYNSICMCDIIIAEGTYSSFSLGHQVTLGLSKGKPVLYLRLDKTNAKNNARASEFVDSVSNPLLNVSNYTLTNIEQVIAGFISRSASTSSVKFNIVISKEIENYLDWASHTYKTTKSQLIRSLIIEKMQHDKFKK